MSQFQFSLHSNVKNLLLNMLDLTTLSQTIVQVVQCDNQLFKCHREECLELCPIHKNFTSPMSFQPLTISSKNDLIQIDEMWFNPFTKQKKQWWLANNLYLYYGEQGHVICECLGFRVYGWSHWWSKLFLWTCNTQNQGIGGYR